MTTHDPHFPTSDLDYIRLLISDVDQLKQVFTDAELSAFLTREGEVRRAAAQALETIASNEVLTSKFIRTQDLETDGTKVSAELRARARELRRQADEADGEAMSDMTFVPLSRPARIELVEEPIRHRWAY